MRVADAGRAGYLPYMAVGRESRGRLRPLVLWCVSGALALIVVSAVVMPIEDPTWPARVVVGFTNGDSTLWQFALMGLCIMVIATAGTFALSRRLTSVHLTRVANATAFVAGAFAVSAWCARLWVTGHEAYEPPTGWIMLILIAVMLLAPVLLGAGVIALVVGGMVQRRAASFLA